MARPRRKSGQITLFEDEQAHDRARTAHALDELFDTARKYRSTEEFSRLLHFVGHFHWYSPYNAMLVHIQKPGATYVARPDIWHANFRRAIRANAQPLVMLRPMGPVMFVFDVSDTEPLPGAPELPPEVTNPFAARSGTVRAELDYTLENAVRNGVRVTTAPDGSQSAGRIMSAQGRRYLQYLVDKGPPPKYVPVPLRYELVLNDHLDRTARYTTLVHELGHLYCGHLGTQNIDWWPDRAYLGGRECEFEAECVCWLVCTRLGIDSASDKYLANFLSNNEELPDISLDTILKAAGLIEQMGRARIVPRKARKK